jgi:CDP-diglyceride synthetase
MKNHPTMRDERYFAVENASYRIGYLILAFGSMVLIIIRSILFQQSNWDFFALIIISSLAATIYQVRNKIISMSWKWVFLMIAAAILAAVFTYLFSMLR